MKIFLSRFRIIFLITAILFSIVSGFHFDFKKEGKKTTIEPVLAPAAEAHYQFTPTGGELVTGTEQTILSATAANAEGVNTGSWKGTLGDDNLHWAVASTSGGYNAQLILGASQLKGANVFIIDNEFDLDATAPSTLVQICDWTTSTSVDNVADGQCTGGGWRTINNLKAALTSTTPSAFRWQIYDGFWTNGSNTPISTPLSNFINGSNQIRVRYYSTTNTTSVVSIDYFRIFAVVHPIYAASGFTNLGSGAVTGEYVNTTAINQGASDDTRLQVAGTAGSVADFYVSFNNVKTYTGMNSVVVRAEYSCSTTGISHRPKIYNFNSASWEDLTTSSILCSATDATDSFAKNNVTLSNYISNGEMRIGWRGLSNSTVALRLDYIYIIVGTTNTNTGDCEISFGTNSAGDCANTRDMDTTTAASTWNIATEDESNTFGHAFYPYDDDVDANVEEAAAANISFAVTQPTNTAVTGIMLAGRFMSGTAGTAQLGVLNYAGGQAVTGGGWTPFGMTATTSLTYGDNITVGGLTGGNPATGVVVTPQQYIDNVNNKMNVRLRTSVAGATSNNSINQWDFAMVSIQWTEDSTYPGSSYQFVPSSSQLVTGTEQAILAATVANNEGVNTGSWKATLEQDAFHWQVASTAGGIDAQLIVGGVQLNGANAFFITTTFDLDATAPNLLVQICDWSSTSSVDNIADSQCTGGGWRTINANKTAISSATPAIYRWQVYDGYWTNGSNSPVSTPLTNFVNSSNQIRIRYFSTTNTTSVVSIDSLSVQPLVNTAFSAAGFTNLGSGTVTGEYSFTSAMVPSFNADDVRLQVAGTAGSVADFYLSFKNIKTYTGMNSVYIRTEYSCSNTGPTHRPKIYNFNSASWEDLTSSSIACATSDATGVFAKNNVTISNYISNGEMRIGWRGLSNSTVALRIDYMYIVLGSTNSNSSDCEISFGTNSAGDCTNTRDVDSTATASTWNIATEDESNTFGHAYYGLDNNGDGVTEEAGASHVKFSVTAPSNASVVGNQFVGRIMSGTGGTVTLSLRDYGNFTGSSLGGFPNVGNSATTSLTPSDSVANLFYGGQFTNAEDFIDTISNQEWLRLRTSAPGATSNNSINQWDFAMAGLSWTETKQTYNQAAYRFYNNADSTDVGSVLAAQDTVATLGSAGASFRLRSLLHLSNDDLRLSEKSFKLQYVGKGTGTCASPSGGTPSSYTDVTGSTLIAYKDNTTPTDGSALTANANDPTHGTDIVRQETYEESNNFTNSQKIINSVQDGLWDFSLKDNSAPLSTTYCLRMVESDGTVFSTYTVYPEITTAAPSVTMSISDSTIGFGSITSSAARYATGDTLGTGVETSAHTLSAGTSSSLGYTLYVQGATLTSGANTIAAIGGTATASSPGTAQFGLRATVSGGSAAVNSPYNTSNYAYAATSSTQDDIGQVAASSTDTYTFYYLGNIAILSKPGSYATNLTYTVVSNF